MAVTEHRKFVFVCAAGNNNKVWEILLHDNDDVEVRYGRIGKSLQSKTHFGAGRRKMESLIKEKTKPSDHYNGGCYREIEVLDTPSTSSSSKIAASSTTELKQIAAKEVATCQITKKLIEFFAEVNAHNIYKATGGKIQYDTSAGTFRTPIGIVTRNNVDKARALLDDITEFINKGSFNKKFITSMEDYLMLIPQDVGRKFDPREFCGDIDAVQKQSQILDGLEASIQSVLVSNVKNEKPTIQPKELFNVKLNVVNDDNQISKIKKIFDEGRQSIHASAKMKLQQAYSVDMVTMRENFEKDGAKMPNIKELWHGTKPSNILSILKNGFMIPPSTASHVCGRLYGNGVYFASSSTKSLNYATSYWGGKDEGRYFMFLCKVAMGNSFMPTGQRSSPPPQGYDSYWAKAGQSGVINDEMIVFRTSQIQPVFLTEWR